MTKAHEQAGNQAFVWMSHGAWTRLLSGDPAVVTRTVWINAVPFRVAGVLPATFTFPHNGENADIYIPLNRADYYQHGAAATEAIVRLRVPSQQFSSELAARAQALAVEFPKSNRELQFSLKPLGLYLLGERLAFLRWLLAAVAILLVISMANASGVWLAQWLKQQRHAAIRMSLGASRSRVLFEQSLQAGLLGLAAGLLGLLGATVLLKILGAQLTQFELWRPASLDWRVACALVALAVVVSLTAAVLPMVVKARKSGRTRLLLAVVQLTLTGTLAYSGLLVGRNVQSLLNADRGFRTEQLLISGIGIPEAVYNTDEKMIRFHQRAIQELSKIPGVTGAAGGVSLPMSNGRTAFQLDDDQSPREQQQRARIGIASPGLLKMLQIPLLAGRGFEPGTDRWNTSRVALVNEAFARKYLTGNPVGHRIRPGFYNGFAMKSYAEHTIVGVIGDTLNRDLALGSKPQIVIDSDQIAMEGFHYFLQSSLPAEALKQAVAQAIWLVDPALERVGVTPLVAYVERSLTSRRTLGWLLALFGALSFAIVAFGLASSLTATFLEMMRELGIRSALGATPVRLAFEATRWGLLAVGVSWALTLPLCVAVSRRVVFDRLPVGFDAASWMAAGIALGAVGLLAGLVPARRAARVDPAVTLRDR